MSSQSHLLQPLPQLTHDNGRILDWLTKITDPEAQQFDRHAHQADIVDRKLRRKRRASTSASLPPHGGPMSPPMTNTESQDGHKRMSRRTPSPKKRRRDVDPHVDDTPRALADPVLGRFARPPPSLSLSLTSASVSDASSSRVSRTSSPSKQLAALAVQQDGIDIRPMDRGDEDMPLQLADMLDLMTNINTGVGVISRIQEDAITQEAAHNPAFRPLHSFFFADPDVRDAVGPTPSIDSVLALHGWATKCQKLRASESAWNCDVHSVLLKLAIHGGYHSRTQLLDVANCTSSGIIRDYLPSHTYDKRVDFCIVLDPGSSTDPNDRATAAAIENRRKTLPELSINHSALVSLLWRPIAVSIETKRITEGNGNLKAQLQIGTWHAAQWNLLSYLVGPRSRHRHIRGNGGRDGDIRIGSDNETSESASGMSPPSAPRSTEAVVAAGEAGDALDGLPFLPAVFISGHDWYFVATTRVGNKTILWSECPFGSTRDVVGIYKVVHGIQQLAAYASNVYWPWYKRAALCL